MAVGKVTLKEGNERKILIDLTEDTAVEDKVLKGYTFHKANGEIVNGTIETYSGTTEIKENGTLATSGKYLENDITINVDGSGSASKIAPTSISFQGYLNDTIDLACLDTSNVTSMNYMFSDCSNLINLDLSSFGTSNVTGMYYMFNSCFNLINLNLSSFDTSNVTNMNGMFVVCKSLTSLDLSSFDTSNVIDMSSMFAGCQSLTTLDVNNFNTSNVTNMSGMFADCQSLTTLDVNNFNTSNVTEMFNMFRNCTQLSILDLSSFDTSNVTHMDGIFGNCPSLQTLKLPVKFNECNSDLGLVGLSNLSQILVPTPALSYYTDSTAKEHCPYFTDNDGLKNKIVGYDTPTTTYTFVTDGGTPVEPITTNGFLQNQVSTPTTEGYTFKGWYFDSEFTKKVKFPYLNLNENNTAITLYAKYGEPEPTSKRYAIDINAMSNPAVPVSYTITSDYKSTGLGDYPDWKSVWFKYTSAQDCNISLINWTQDLNWQVIKADDNSLVAENDPEEAQVSLTANTQYYIAIAIWDGRLGSFTTGFNIQGV